MTKGIKISKFMQGLFDEPTAAQKAAEIGQAMLEAQSVRLTDREPLKCPGIAMPTISAFSAFSAKPIHGKGSGVCFKKRPNLSSVIHPKSDAPKPTKLRMLVPSGMARQKVSGRCCSPRLTGDGPFPAG